MPSGLASFCAGVGGQSGARAQFAGSSFPISSRWRSSKMCFSRTYMGERSRGALQRAEAEDFHIRTARHIAESRRGMDRPMPTISSFAREEDEGLRGRATLEQHRGVLRAHRGRRRRRQEHVQGHSTVAARTGARSQSAAGHAWGRERQKGGAPIYSMRAFFRLGSFGHFFRSS